MSIIFVHELENVRKRLGWKEAGSLNETQVALLRRIVLCERELEKVEQ